MRPDFRASWRAFTQAGRSRRSLVAVGLGTAAFSMEDVLLEPYGGQVLHLSVGATTALTALLAVGGLTGFTIAAQRLGRGADPYRLAALGILTGVAAFCAVIFAAPCDSAFLFGLGTSLIGLGGGLFAHSTLTAAMGHAKSGQIGLALGVWGAVQASAAGIAIALGGLLRDAVTAVAMQGTFGDALANAATGSSFVYHLEIALLFATLVAIGPLVRRTSPAYAQNVSKFGLAEISG
jgi:BCD family chlorophyll transporter-like MFS transporter